MHNPVISGIIVNSRDITKRKEVERALRENERRLESLMANLPGMAYRCANDAEWTMEFASEGCQALTGYAPSDIVGSVKVSYGELIVPEDRAAAWDTVQKAIAKKQPYGLTYQIRTANGELRWVREQGAGVFAADGKVAALEGFIADITAYRRAQDRIVKVNRLYITLSGINKVVVHAQNRSELFKDVCRVSTDEGQFAIAWIGLIDSPGSSVTCAASSKLSTDDEALIVESIGNLDQGRSRTATAVSENRVVYTNSYVAQIATTQWHTEAVKRGVLGSATVPITADGRSVGVFKLYVSEPEFFDDEQIALLEEMGKTLSFALESFNEEAMRKEVEERLLTSQKKLMSTLSGTIEAIALTVEMRDMFTAGHQKHATELAVAIAGELGLPADQIEGIRVGASIFDIGKIAIPAEILNRPGRLREQEYALVKSHPQVGYDIVKNIDFPWPVAQMILHHHERLDGSGYPDGLKGEAILLEARIIGIADAVEAMCSHRPYRSALGVDAALAEIIGQRGKLYDPAAVDACVRLFREKGFRLTA